MLFFRDDQLILSNRLLELRRASFTDGMTTELARKFIVTHNCTVAHSATHAHNTS